MAAGTTIVCGLERLSLRVAAALLQLGERVTIVARAPDPQLLAEARAAGARFVEGVSADIVHVPGVNLDSARCLVLTENTDLGNLHAALAARDANPRLRVVIRMFNADLADRATRLLSNSRVISSSYEAAPHFAAAALGIESAPTRLVWGRHFRLDSAQEAGAPRVPARPQGPRLSALRLQARFAAVMASIRAQAGRTPAPRRDGDVDLGDGQVLAPLDGPVARVRRPHLRLRGFRRALLAFLDRRLAVVASTFAVLIGVSVVVFHAFRGLSWIDALYFTITTASTVGYGDFSLAGAPWGLKLFGVGFMLMAALVVALLYALAADAVIGARILEALGVPRGRMGDHVVVIGVGSVGYRIVQRMLDLGVDAAAVELSERSRFVPLVRRQGVPVLVGDGRYSDSLRIVSVERARAIVAVTDDDLANIEAALTARDLNPTARIVARLFDPELAERAQRQFGIDSCHSVSALASPAFAAAAIGDGVLSTLERHGRLWLLAETRVQPGTASAGARVAALESSGDVLVLAVRQGTDERWRPECPEHLAAGCDVLVACSRPAWERFSPVPGTA